MPTISAHANLLHYIGMHPRHMQYTLKLTTQFLYLRQYVNKVNVIQKLQTNSALELE